MEAALTFEDPLISAYRVHCQAYKRGFSVRQIVGEMFGKGNGATGGKGGSMHYYNKKTHFYGGNGIVGAQIPVGVGLAFALKYQNKNNVASIMFGDGAANQGQLFEAANMAKLWNLPALFICENNIYGMGTSVERSSMNPHFYTRGDQIPGIRADGNNVFEVREVMKFAKKYAQ
jgi:pyruvate dehydrogenase E1 component alpha subunit